MTKKSESVIGNTGQPKCETHRPHNLGWLEWDADSEKRQKAGQRQKQCPVCKYWFYKDQF